MARVHLLGDLRRRCEGRKTVDVEATNVSELIAELERRCPDLRDVGLAHMSVAIDGEIMANADYLSVGPNSEIHFLPAISGGGATHHVTHLGRYM